MDTSLSRALTLLNQANTDFDLTNNQHQTHLLDLADNLLALTDLKFSQLLELSTQHDAPLEFQLALKLVDSRQKVLAFTKPVNVGVVFAMWGEHHRLLPKSQSNPNGEDSLRIKIRQLDWVTRDSQVQWQIYAVDDGCPHDSAHIAKRIAHEQPRAISERVKVLQLSRALPSKVGPLQSLDSVEDSRKGGSIILGCEYALSAGVDGVLYTDADNSVHLGQLGLVLDPYMNHNKQVVLGNRKHADSILVKQEERWGAGIKTLRHMQRMIGSQIFDQGIKDTQAAFKFYSRPVLEKILLKPTVYDFSFDTDWILAAMEMNQPITTVPFAFIDSAAESASVTQGPMTTWYVLLDGLVKAVKARKADYSEEMADVFVREISSHKDLELIIDTVPPELAIASDKDLGNPRVMSPQSVRNWILSAKSLRSRQANPKSVSPEQA
ncbi:glycosyltransferase [Vibrio renipiscarius]|uniref:Glycosyltransferase n=1 Tax=Vibrio renipiscarius TaxID=1461322 RepID=A0A0C2NAL4_9VIBR|nr:glycosyltransferase [Vibrio renipiscarius]KII76651.1 glycosyltransferase [Vibrio renipiscarius]KII77828.1 glycosyltransferase [Vibrio renipiscarius]